MLSQFPLNGDNSKARGLLNFIIQVVMRISSNYSPFRLLLKYEAISFEFDMNWNLQITWKLEHYVNSKVTVYLLIVICVVLCLLYCWNENQHAPDIFRKRFTSHYFVPSPKSIWVELSLGSHFKCQCRKANDSIEICIFGNSNLIHCTYCKYTRNEMRT